MMVGVTTQYELYVDLIGLICLDHVLFLHVDIAIMDIKLNNEVMKWMFSPQESTTPLGDVHVFAGTPRCEY